MAQTTVKKIASCALWALVADLLPSFDVLFWYICTAYSPSIECSACPTRFRLSANQSISRISSRRGCLPGVFPSRSIRRLQVGAKGCLSSLVAGRFIYQPRNRFRIVPRPLDGHTSWDVSCFLLLVASTDSRMSVLLTKEEYSKDSTSHREATGN